MTRIIDPAFLFRFSIPCPKVEGKWVPRGVNLPEQNRLPNFGRFSGGRQFADIRLGWNETGLFLDANITGKTQPPWCRDSRLEDSDGLQIWIDTRDTHSVHRAGRFCHRFVFLPTGGGRSLDDPMATLMIIHRAKENPKTIPANLLKVLCDKRADGYHLLAHIPADALTGFDPAEHKKLGFFYAVMDRELGWQTFSIGAEFPFQEDPSLWGTLEME